jgi:hypothetical protein
VKQSNGKIVCHQLEEAIEKTGIPREIIGDHGSDLEKGIKDFCLQHQETCYIYDIKHKTAAVLKHELQNDEKWLKFIELATKTKVSVQQTTLAFLSPPNQRSKSRYMNIDILIKWGLKTLAFIDQQQKEKNNKFDNDQIGEKLGWITAFCEMLTELDDVLQIVETTESFVRKNGLYNGCHIELKDTMVLMANTDRAKKVKGLLLAFVEEESSKAKPDERLLGSSEELNKIRQKVDSLIFC